MTQDAVMKKTEVTREHRILAVKAHTGFLDWDHRSLSEWAPAFVDGTAENNALQQIAQAIADAEARGEARNATNARPGLDSAGRT